MGIASTATASPCLYWYWASHTHAKTPACTHTQLTCHSWCEHHGIQQHTQGCGPLLASSAPESASCPQEQASLRLETFHGRAVGTPQQVMAAVQLMQAGLEDEVGYWSRRADKAKSQQVCAALAAGRRSGEHGLWPHLCAAALAAGVHAGTPP